MNTITQDTDQVTAPAALVKGDYISLYFEHGAPYRGCTVISNKGGVLKVNPHSKMRYNGTSTLTIRLSDMTLDVCSGSRPVVSKIMAFVFGDGSTHCGRAAVAS